MGDKKKWVIGIGVVAVSAMLIWMFTGSSGKDSLKEYQDDPDTTERVAQQKGQDKASSGGSSEAQVSTEAPASGSSDAKPAADKDPSTEKAERTPVRDDYATDVTGKPSGQGTGESKRDVEDTMARFIKTSESVVRGGEKDYISNIERMRQYTTSRYMGDIAPLLESWAGQYKVYKMSNYDASFLEGYDDPNKDVLQMVVSYDLKIQGEDGKAYTMPGVKAVYTLRPEDGRFKVDSIRV